MPRTVRSSPFPFPTSLNSLLSAQAVTSYFSQANPNALPYGFVPEIAALKAANSPGPAAAKTSTTAATATTAKTPAVSPAPAPGLSQGVTGVSLEHGVGVKEVPSAGGESLLKNPAVASENAATKEPVGQEEQADNKVLLTLPPPQQQQKELMLTEVESEEDVEAFLNKAGPDRLVLVDFGAEWCKNCQGMLVGESIFC